MATKVKYLTKRQVEALIDNKNKELFTCFNKLVKDVESVKRSNERIERVLIGDKDYQDKGIMERLEPVLQHYELLERAGVWSVLSEIADKYKAIKWFSVVITTGGLVSLASITWEIIKILGK